MLVPQRARPRGRRTRRGRCMRPSSSSASTIGASGPRSHSPIGASNPCFGPIDDRLRHAALEQPPQQILAAPVFQLQRRRHGRGELEQLVIEQRLARFERHRHAHPVDLGHDVVDQIRLHVHVQRAVERIAATGTRRTPRGSRRTDRRRARCAAKSVRVERVARVGLEQAVRVLAARTRRRATARGAGATARPCSASGSTAAESPGDRAADRSEPSPRRRFPPLDPVTRVAGPELVAAVARQRHGDVLARRRRHVVGRHRRRVGERLVEVPRELRQQIDDVGRDDLLVLLASEMLGDGARVLQLVERAARRIRPTS